MRARDMERLKKRLEKAFFNEKDPDLYPHLCEQASLVCSDDEWAEIDKFTSDLRAKDKPNTPATPPVATDTCPAHAEPVPPVSEIVTALARDLEADATDPPTGMSELARLVGLEAGVKTLISSIAEDMRQLQWPVIGREYAIRYRDRLTALLSASTVPVAEAAEGLEGWVRAIADDLWQWHEDTTECDDYHRGYKFACRSIAAELRAALKTPPPAPPVPPAGEPGMLTDAQGWKVWRELEARGARVSFGHTQGRAWCAISEQFPIRRKETAHDPDPLRALSQAVAAFEAAERLAMLETYRKKEDNEPI